MFIKYPKIHRFGKEETEGILNGFIIVQEKIDGANSSVWLEDNKICIGSRTQVLCDKENIHNGFNGLCEYVLKHEGIKKLLTDFPQYRLYGEWLVQHTIQYAPQYYKKFWMYDIMIDGDSENPVFLDPVKTNELAKQYGIESPRIFEVVKDPDLDSLKKYLEQPNLGDRIEGVVLKNTQFVNKFGRPCYAKIVCDRFKEESKIIFGNANKYDSLEFRRAVKYMTPGRFLKIVNKIEQQKQEKFSEKFIGEIIGRSQYDVITEEIASIVKNETVNFGILRREITQITRTMALQYIEQGEKAPIFTYNHQGNEENNNV